MKLDSLGNFVPLYFSLRWTFLLPLFPGALAIVELENYYTNYKHLVWLFGSKKENIIFLKVYCNMLVVLFMTQHVHIYNFVNSS